MKWFYNLKIGVKLIISFIIVAIISGVVGLIGIINLRKMDYNDTVLYENMTVPLTEVADMARLFQRARVNARDLILHDDQEVIKDTYEYIQDFLVEINRIAESFSKTIIQDDVAQIFQTYIEAIDRFNEDLDELYELCMQNKDDEAYEFTKGDFQTSSDDVRIAIDKLLELKVNGAKDQSNINAVTANTAVVTMIAVIACAMFIAVVLGIFISNIISKPVRKIAEAADKIADGDLDVSVDIYTKEEIGQLANAFNKMANNLNDVISNINMAADQVAAGSKQVSDTSIALSQGATEQASTIEQLTVSLEEIAAQTKLNADNSDQASSLAETAKDNAIKGNTQMKDMLKAMEEINLSSNNISKIIKVIDEIAFQTNILALNAAVEAARAGQHGKGFAVVAEEVRNLAARSASAAKETTEMIEDSIKNVEAGTEIAMQTSEALNEIVNEVSKVANLIGDIAVASNEQASGIEQINQGIMMVSEVVQNNSTTSEESAAASEELSSQADMLKEQVLKFKLRKSGNNTFSFGGMGNVKQDIMKMFEKKTDNNKAVNAPEKKSTSNNTEDTPKIILSDKEFGKY